MAVSVFLDDLEPDLPRRIELHLVAGMTFRCQITWLAAGVPVILTGWDALLRFETRSGATVDLTPGDGLTIDGPAGRVDVLLTADEVAALVPAADYEFVIWPPGGDRTVLVAGLAVVSRSLTLP